MAGEFKISVDLAGLLQMGPLVRAGVFQNLSGAVERVAMAGAERWRAEVARAKLWEGERRAYSETIRWEMRGPYEALISSDYKFVEDIETGRPPRDLKRMLDSSPKVRVSKKGKRYLIIPMRHNTPGNDALARAMPQHVYDLASDLAPSRVVGMGTRVSGSGAFDVKTRAPMTVAARKYVWGGRLPAGTVPKLKQSHATDPYAGMVRFDARTPGGARSSTYLTFRVMVEGSSGWIVPAQPGLHIAQSVAESLRPIAEKFFAEAVRIDTSSAA